MEPTQTIAFIARKFSVRLALYAEDINRILASRSSIEAEYAKTGNHSLDSLHAEKEKAFADTALMVDGYCRAAEDAFALDASSRPIHREFWKMVDDDSATSEKIESMIMRHAMRQ